MRVVVAAVVCLGMSTFNFADTPTEPGELLSKMSQNHRQLNYRGIVTFQVGDRLSSFRVSHVVHNGREYESLEPLDGELDELERDGHALNCVHPGNQLVEMLGKGADDEGLNRFYQIDFEGPYRQAGRAASQLLIRPRDVYRYGYRLVLDDESGLLLRSDILNQQGQAIERFQYVELELEVTPEEEIARSNPQLHSEYHLSAAADKELKRPAWRPGVIPAGFTLTDPAIPDGDSLSFTDGLAVLSIFSEPLDPSQTDAVDGGMRRGASVSYSVAFPEHQSLITVIGEVPMITAREVARSVTWLTQ